MNEVNESNDVKNETSSEFNETADNNYENYVNCNAEKHIENSENDVNKDEISSELLKDLDDVYNRYITDSGDNVAFESEKSDVSMSQQEDLSNDLESDNKNQYNEDVKNYAFKERSFVDRAKDTVFGTESAYDAERFEKAGIKGAFDDLPRSRREAVYERFENAPDDIKKTVNELSSELSVENTKNDDCCHYDLATKKIRMESNMDNAEYSEVFSHEYGHFVDNKKGDVSDTYEFRDAMAKDLEQYDRSTEVGKQNFDNMMDDLMSSDAAYDRAISDNMSAYFKNDPEIIQRYWDEGIDYYRHDNNYWSMPGNREAEIYANSFSMSAQDNKASCEFMQKHFPNTWEEFKKTL